MKWHHWHMVPFFLIFTKTMEPLWTYAAAPNDSGSRWKNKCLHEQHTATLDYEPVSWSFIELCASMSSFRFCYWNRSANVWWWTCILWLLSVCSWINRGNLIELEREGWTSPTAAWCTGETVRSAITTASLLCQNVQNRFYISVRSLKANWS